MKNELSYIYNPTTNEYMHSVPALPDGTLSHSTEVAPPETTYNEVAVWDGKKWKKVPDYRRQMVWDKYTQKQVRIEKLGLLPDNLTDKRPTDRYMKFDEKKKDWVHDKERWMSEYVRPVRDQLLTDSDKYMIPDFPISDAEREKWKEYRQALRELPKKIKGTTVKWPKRPE